MVNLKYEVIYFIMCMVQSNKQGSMATVIGIFQYQYKRGIPLTIVSLVLNQENLLI